MCSSVSDEPRQEDTEALAGAEITVGTRLAVKATAIYLLSASDAP